MTYNIFDSKAPAMPKFAKGTEICKLLVSKASPDMRPVLLPMVIPALAAHLTDTKFEYSDGRKYELAGQIGHLIGHSASGKGQLGHLLEAILRSFRQHDQLEFERLYDWQRQMKTRAANGKKPEKPAISIWLPPADMTSAAFLENAISLEKMGGRTQFLNLPELEACDKICGGHRQVSQVLRNVYDCERSGALRASSEGVCGVPILRANLTFSSTPEVARQFYRKDLSNGFFGRISFAFKARGERSGTIPRQSSYDEKFLAKPDEFLLRLDNCKGEFKVSQMNKIADQLAEEMAELAELTDDDTLFELSHRCIFAAWKKAATLWILNDQTWTRSIGEFMIWFCYFDLWSKVQIFGDLFKAGDVKSDDAQKGGPKNMLDSLENSFNEKQLEDLRVTLGKSKEGTKHQLNVWKNRHFITFCAETKLFTKTEKYLHSKS